MITTVPLIPTFFYSFLSTPILFIFSFFVFPSSENVPVPAIWRLQSGTGPASFFPPLGPLVRPRLPTLNTAIRHPLFEISHHIA